MFFLYFLLFQVSTVAVDRALEFKNSKSERYVTSRAKVRKHMRASEVSWLLFQWHTRKRVAGGKQSRHGFEINL